MHDDARRTDPALAHSDLPHHVLADLHAARDDELVGVAVARLPEGLRMRRHAAPASLRDLAGRAPTVAVSKIAHASHPLKDVLVAHHHLHRLLLSHCNGCKTGVVLGAEARENRYEIDSL